MRVGLCMYMCVRLHLVCVFARAVTGSKITLLSPSPRPRHLPQLLEPISALQLLIDHLPPGS